MRKEIKVLPILTLFLGIALSPLHAAGGEPSLDDHWRRPAEAGSPAYSLLPEKCGSCHAGQYAAWKGSLHARSVGPGLLGQLDIEEDPATALSCYICHAPLTAQQEVELGMAGDPLPNPRFDRRLKGAGVTCSACHVRDGGVLGPPRKAKLKVKASPGPGHGPATARRYFQSAEFCAACHQLDDGYQLNGKPLTNTYREWEQSGWAAQGVQCQNCHMPDRAHLFKGIHDADMTRRAVDISMAREGGTVTLAIANVGAGHYFPTYVTPLVVIKAFALDRAGKPVAGSLKEEVIARIVSLDLSHEVSDTRISPGGERRFTFGKAPSAAAVAFEVWVQPDHFYHGLFKSLLDGGAAADPALIRKAMDSAAASSYLLWKGETRLIP